MERARTFIYALLGLVLLSVTTISTVYWWLGKPITLPAPISAATKLDCLSYAPFRGRQSPLSPEFVIQADQIRQDLTELAKVTKCVRIYSVDSGLDKVPALAAEAGLTVILGAWIGRDRQKNALLIDSAVSLVNAHPDTITALVVGNEVLLRGEMLPSELRRLIRSAKERVNIPVSYAEVWESWLRYPEIAADVDFVTVHILPYWEDAPVRAEDAAAHVDSIRQRLAAAFPGKEVLIGETGWPSRGRMRAGALPSRINQARFVNDIVERSRRENFRVTLFEAFDERWKRMWEGTVGGSWGVFGGRHRDLNYLPELSIGNHPLWKLQLGLGIAFSLGTFGIAALAVRRRRSAPRRTAWLAVAACATIGGSLLGLSAEELIYESYGFGGWIMEVLLFLAAMAAPLLAAEALVSDRRPPGFVDLIGPGEAKLSFPDRLLGLVLMAITLIATEIALSHVFDPRWRDFHFASLTMAVAPFLILAVVNGQKSGSPPLAETVFASLFALASFYGAVHEGSHNWQSLWTMATFLLLGATLYQARTVSDEQPASDQVSSSDAVQQVLPEANDALGACKPAGHAASRNRKPEQASPAA